MIKREFFQVGSSWNIDSDPCTTMNCVQNSETGEISIQKVIQLCNTTCDIVSNRYITSTLLWTMDY